MQHACHRRPGPTLDRNTSRRRRPTATQSFRARPGPVTSRRNDRRMRCFPASLLVSLLVLSLPTGAAADPARPCVDGPNLRATRPWIAQLVREVAPRSSTLRTLIAELRGAPVVVHLNDDLGDHGDWDGRLRFVTRAGGCRYLRIDLRDAGSSEARAALLAHELQHAVEVARAGVDDRGALTRLFRRIGFDVPDGSGTTFDTAAAVAAGRRALMELSDPPAPDPQRR